MYHAVSLLSLALATGCAQFEDRPAESQAVSEFRARTLAFTREGRALARLLLKGPSPPAYDAQLAKVRAACRRIPDPPTGGLASARARADGVLEIFEAARAAVRHQATMRKVAKKYPESKDYGMNFEKPWFRLHLAERPRPVQGGAGDDVTDVVRLQPLEQLADAVRLELENALGVAALQGRLG
jgi:hypothetical protein